MAFSQNITLENGVTVQNAYIRIENIWIFKGVKTIEFVVNYFSRQPILNAETMQLDIPPFQQEVIKIFSQNYDEWASVDKLQESNPFKIGYEYLKTLDQFSNAIDC